MSKTLRNHYNHYPISKKPSASVCIFLCGSPGRGERRERSPQRISSFLHPIYLLSTLYGCSAGLLCKVNLHIHFLTLRTFLFMHCPSLAFFAFCTNARQWQWPMANPPALASSVANSHTASRHTASRWRWQDPAN